MGTDKLTPAATPLDVLLVEDDRDVAESLRMLLEVAGHRPRVAVDAAQVLEGTGPPPAVALVDIGLPRTDGHELARRLRVRPEWRCVVLVALSGYGTSEDKQRATAAGFDRHLTKPVEVEALLALLDAIGARAALPGEAD
jgi:DNA-binding response OmpR family regulator